MRYSTITVTRDTRKAKKVIFSNFYRTGFEKDVLLQFLGRFNDSDEIDVDDISKLIAVSSLNVRFKIKGKGLKHYYNPHIDPNGRVHRRINRASIAQIKEIIQDRNINREFREELLEFLDDRANPNSPNYNMPFKINDKCDWDEFNFDEQFLDCKIKDLFRIGLSRGIVRVPTKEKYLNNLLRSHNLPYKLEEIGLDKPIFRVREIKPEPMVIKIYR